MTEEEGPRYAPHELGRAGETMAAAHLSDMGWVVLHRNYRFGRREIDIVAIRDGVLAFVEVKTRTRGLCGGPLHAVGYAKRREIEAVARHLLTRLAETPAGVRFDVIGIEGDPGGPDVTLTHVEDAWRPGR